jgi:hypothetical protein
METLAEATEAAQSIDIESEDVPHHNTRNDGTKRAVASATEKKKTKKKKISIGGGGDRLCIFQRSRVNTNSMEW